MSFSQELIEAGQPYLIANQQHPFIQSVLHNQVDAKALAYYIQQDLQYANAETIVQTALVANSQTVADQQLFADQLSRHLKSVSALFQQLSQNNHNDWSQQQKATVQPVTFLYRQHILSSLPSANLLAILTPFEAGIWLYVELGKFLSQSGQVRQDNPFYPWVDDLQHGEFAGEDGISNQFMAVIDREAAKASDQQLAAAKEAFLRSSLFEWYFWDAAFKQVTWENWTASALDGQAGDLL